MKVKDIMMREIVTVQEDQTKQQAARLLSNYHISGLPVVDKDRMVVGIVTEFDVLARDGSRVNDIMTRGVISVTPDTNLEDVTHILVHQRIKRVLVLDQGKLVGIVSRADLVNEVATRWVCPVCGEIMHTSLEPQQCTRCGASALSELELLAPGF